MNKWLVFAVAGVLLPQSVLAEDCCSLARPDAYAPIGVMGDHLHRKGTWMFGYRYMYNEMSYDGSSPKMDSGHKMMTDHLLDVPKHGDVEPDANPYPKPSHDHEMAMQMHMIEAMYGVSDKVNLMLMVPFQQMDMDHGIPGAESVSRSGGVGDVSVWGMFRLYEENEDRLHFNAAVSLPTGSITEDDEWHGSPQKMRLPYDMQSGSGTFDLLPGINFISSFDTFSIGTQLSATLRMGENNQDYTLGDRYRASVWGSYLWCDWFSSSLRVFGEIWEDVAGEDEDLKIISSFANPDEQAGRSLSAALGGNFYVPEGYLAGGRFAFEFGVPLAQELDDGVHDSDWFFNLGVQWSI